MDAGDAALQPGQLCSLVVEVGQQVIRFSGCAASRHKSAHAAVGFVEPGLDSVEAALDGADDEDLDAEEGDAKPRENAEPEVLTEGFGFRVGLPMHCVEMCSAQGCAPKVNSRTPIDHAVFSGAGLRRANRRLGLLSPRHCGRICRFLATSQKTGNSLVKIWRANRG